MMHVFEWWGGEYHLLEELIAEMDEVKKKKTGVSIEFRNSLYAGIQGRKCRRREQVGNILRIHGAGIGSKLE